MTERPPPPPMPKMGYLDQRIRFKGGKPSLWVRIRRWWWKSTKRYRGR